jgi:hypothetical protein
MLCIEKQLMMSLEDDCSEILLFFARILDYFFLCIDTAFLGGDRYYKLSVYYGYELHQQHLEWEMQHIAFIVLTLQFSLGSFFPRFSMTKKVSRFKIVLIYMTKTYLYFNREKKELTKFLHISARIRRLLNAQ